MIWFIFCILSYRFEFVNLVLQFLITVPVLKHPIGQAGLSKVVLPGQSANFAISS